MNFAGPFDAKSLTDSPVPLDGEGFSFGAKPGFVQHHPSDAHVVVPDAHLLFSGHYVRIGSDLIISNADQKFVVGNYFKGEARPALTTNDGATLSGQIVDALTGHVHYAQAGAPAAAAQVIGHVLKMSGGATAIRNGVSIELHIGDAVQKGDVVQTGADSSIGMTFVDGSAFGMTSNARMVLNEMIYDPNGSSNSSLISLVQGTITFVAGQTAKNGNMRVETPVATMGIRGTAVLVEIAANDGPTKFSVLLEPDGHTGSFNLYDKTTGQLIGTVSQAGQVTLVSSLGIGQPPTAIEQLKTLADQEAAKSIINQVFQLYFPNFNPDNSNPKTQKFGSSSVNPLSDWIFGGAKFGLLPPPSLPQIIYVVDPITGTVTYNGRVFYNTKAVFSADSVTAEQSFVSSVKTFKISDVVHINDPDIGNAPFYDEAVPFVAGSAVIKSAVSTNPNLDANFLSQFLHIDQTTGVVSFDRLGFNFLGQGESVTFMLQVTSRSGPDVAQVIIPITITGDNDAPNDNGAPTIVLPLSDIVGAVKEDTPVGVSSLAANGTITFRDVDLTDTHTVAKDFTSASSTLPGFAGAPLGTFTIDLDPENTTDIVNTGTVKWHFSLPDNDPVLQSLAEGQTITQVYTITIKDIHDALVTQTVTVTITGTNDAPVLSADASVHQALEVPDTTGAPNSVVDVATGTLAFTDVDLSDTHTASAALHPDASSVVWSGGNYNDIPQATRDALNAAVTASVSENNTDTNNQGSVGWEFKLPDHLLDFLADNETLTLIYDVTVTDNNGVSSTQQVTVQIGAANDQPVISVIDNCAAVKEDVDPVGCFLKDTGSVTFTDADLTDTHTAHVAYNNDAAGSAGVSPALALALATALTVPSSTLAAGDHDFNWDFALNTSLVQYLAEGETITATYTITVKDSSGESNGTSAGQVVTVTITGTNDAPTIAVTNPVADTEGNTGTPDVAVVTVADHVSTSDVDASDVHVPYAGALAFDAANSSGPLPASGSLADLFTVNATDGKISYDKAAFDYLAAGEHVTAIFTFNSSSGPDTLPQTITITINGENDAPTVATALTLATSEGDAPVVRDLLHGASDVDASDTLSVTNIQYSIDGGLQTATTPGGVTILPDGHTINVDGANPAFDHLAAGATQEIVVSYNVTDTHGVSVAQTETITIAGLNDRPVLAAGMDLTTITEDQTSNSGQSVGSFATGISDADDGALKGVAITGYTNQNGHWEYSIDGGTIWTTFGTYSSASGLLLASDDKVRFIPNGENGGTDTLTYVAWDQSSGTHGTVTNTALAEHWAPFSQDSQTASLLVTPVNDAAIIGDPPLADVREGITDSAGNLVTSGTLSISDVDSPASFSTTVADAIGHTNLGALSLQADGQYVYSVANSNPSVQALTGTQTHVDVFTIQSQDGTSKDISFTIDGVTEIASAAPADEMLTATAGRDNFVFNSAFGHDTITGFTLGVDAVVFDHSLFATVADVIAAATSSGSDTVITHGTDTVTLAGISLAQVQAHQNDFHIV